MTRRENLKSPTWLITFYNSSSAGFCKMAWPINCAAVPSDPKAPVFGVWAKIEIMDEATSRLDYSASDGVATITLNDPPANTYSYEMMQQLDRAILAARMDDSVQVIVITGKGEKFFCAGADIQMLANVTPAFKYYFCLHANETLNRVE